MKRILDICLIIASLIIKTKKYEKHFTNICHRFRSINNHKGTSSNTSTDVVYRIFKGKSYQENIDTKHKDYISVWQKGDPIAIIKTLTNYEMIYQEVGKKSTKFFETIR